MIDNSASIPKREEIPANSTWDLSGLFPNPSAWMEALSALQQECEQLSTLKGTLGSSVEALHKATVFSLSISKELEKIYTYAHLLSDTDTANTLHFGYLQQALNLYTKISSLSSFFTPELLSIKENVLDQFLLDPQLQPFERMIREIVRFRPHVLSEKEEKLLAMGGEVFQSCEKIFSQLNNADFSFGTLTVDGEELPLSHGSYFIYIKNSNRGVRAEAFHRYYSVYEGHKNAIASSLTGSIQKDVYLARIKNYPSALAAALFPDNVKMEVYDNLLETVSKHTSHLHRYYAIRKKHLALDEQRIFDTYVPLAEGKKVKHSYEEACSHVLKALAPLGDEYCTVLREGLLHKRWVDVYENKGKRSGAYSSGCYTSPPYILLNYKEENLSDMFTLAHEAGHSMHSYLSHQHQPYQDSSYSIFVAEVASTFNELLLSAYLRKHFANDERMLTYLVNQEVDDIKMTLYRQTMFAEFEKIAHEIAEEDQPLTVDVFRKIYRGLLEKFFGSSVAIHPLDELEFSRIPHFYSAFYVYKYATGISAAVSLSENVLQGRSGAVENYLSFLKAGCSKPPLEVLQKAGVDMTSSLPIKTALGKFSTLLDKLEGLL